MNLITRSWDRCVTDPSKVLLATYSGEAYLKDHIRKTPSGEGRGTVTTEVFNITKISKGH